MGLHIGAVDRHRAAEVSGCGQSLEHLLPDSATGPAVEAIVDGRPRAVFTRTDTPRAARLQHMENAAQDATVIDPPGARLICWQHRPDQ